MREAECREDRKAEKSKYRLSRCVDDLGQFPMLRMSRWA